MTTTKAQLAAAAALATTLLAAPALAHGATIAMPCGVCAVAEPSPGLPTPGAPDRSAPPEGEPGAPTPGTPRPAPGPAPAPTPDPAAPQRNWDGPATVPNPPAIGGATWTPPAYQTPPVLPTAIAPSTVVPVKPVVPPLDSVRVGTLVTPIPPGMALADVRAINRWAAFTEAQIATGLVAAGVPRDEASRRAASTVLGAAIGAGVAGAPAATLGAAAGFVPGAIAGGIAGGVAAVPIAIAVAPVIPPAVAVPLGVALGAAGGGVAGAAGGALLLGIPAAIGGGIGGGAIAYSLGAGNPHKGPGQRPEQLGDQGDPWKPAPPHPQENQYEAAYDHGPVSGAYTVDRDGDVSATVAVAGHQTRVGWTAELADGPYRALGFVAQTARDTVTREVVTLDDIAQHAIDSLTIDYPQYRGKHRKGQ